VKQVSVMGDKATLYITRPFATYCLQLWWFSCSIPTLKWLPIATVASVTIWYFLLVFHCWFLLWLIFFHCMFVTFWEASDKDKLLQEQNVTSISLSWPEQAASHQDSFTKPRKGAWWHWTRDCGTLITQEEAGTTITQEDPATTITQEAS
jgi:hypothetical protein